MKKYRATVILACYNKENFLKRSLDSLVNLSLFNEMEVILVDDNSNDDSVSIIKEYTEIYNNIKLIKLDIGSGGPSKPRNIGIEAAQGKYLIFMDPDDLVINDGYSLLIKKIEELDSDILIATRVGVNSYGKEVWIDYIDNDAFINKNNEKIQKDLLIRRPFILKTIYSKDLIMKNNIRFNDKISTSEDECFDMECVSYANKITKINDIVYQYTVEADNSITTSVSIKTYEQLYDVMLELERVYSKMFNQKIVNNRIVGLLKVFYAVKMPYLNNPSDMKKAFELFYDACNKFGFEKLLDVSSGPYYNFVLDIKNKKFVDVLSLNVQMYKQKNLNIVKELNELTKNKNEQIKSLKKRIKARSYKRRAINKIKRVKRKILNQKTINENNKNEEQVNENLLNYDRLKAIESKSNGYWIFIDKKNEARDNAEVLYRYVKNNNIHDKIAFIINENSKDYDRLRNDGFNLIKWGSFEHLLILRDAQYLFTSNCSDENLMPWCVNLPDRAIKNNEMTQQFKLIFIQHEVIRNEMSGWLGSKNIHKIICSSQVEADSLVDIPNYLIDKNQIILSGLARFDNLSLDKKSFEEKSIVILPTWKKEYNLINNNLNCNTLSQDFYRKWELFFKSDKVSDLINKEKVKIKLILNGANTNSYNYMKDILGDKVELIMYNDIESFAELVNNNSMLVTDYSSLSFDFLYAKKPVIYFDFEKRALKDNLVNMEYSKYGFYSSEVDEVVNEVFDNIKNNFEISKYYSKNIDELFKYRDHSNCARIMKHFKE